MSIKTRVRRRAEEREARLSVIQKCPKDGQNEAAPDALGGAAWWPACPSPSLLFIKQRLFSPSSLPPCCPPSPPPPLRPEGTLAAPQTLTDRCPW